LCKKDIKLLRAKDSNNDDNSKRVVYGNNEDPILKRELSKYNFSDMIDLNRDFQFYINHPDKMKRIQRLKKAQSSKHKFSSAPYTSGYSNMNKMNNEDDSSLMDKENMVRHNNHMAGVARMSRNIGKISDITRSNGIVSYGERKKLLKNLF